jgi:hypothetical protein
VRTGAGLILALLSAIALNWGFFVQHGASNTLPQLSLRRPLRSLRLLFTNARWLLGYVAGIGGWGLYIAALDLAQLSLVQAVSAAGVGVLALFVWRAGLAHFSRSEWVAVSVTLFGLALLLLSFLGGVPAPARVDGGGALVWVGVTMAAALLAWQPGSRFVRPGAGLGAAAGLLYASGDVSTKGAVVGVGLFFVPLLLLCHLLGFVALQLSFQRGTALSTAGLSTLLNNAVPIVAGVLLFHERLPAGPAGVLRALSFAVVVLGAALLARPERQARAEAERPACAVSTTSAVEALAEPDQLRGELAAPEPHRVAARVGVEAVGDAVLAEELGEGDVLREEAERIRRARIEGETELSPLESADLAG